MVAQQDQHDEEETKLLGQVETRGVCTAERDRGQCGELETACFNGISI